MLAITAEKLGRVPQALVIDCMLDPGLDAARDAVSSRDRLWEKLQCRGRQAERLPS